MSRVLVVAITAVVVVGACGDGDADHTTDAQGTFAAAGDGLCHAAAVAHQPEAAERTFYDRTHQALHVLADDITTQDRAVAAALLRAKQAVEAALDSDDLALRDAIDELVARTDAALRVLDHPGLPCAHQP